MLASGGACFSLLTILPRRPRSVDWLWNFKGTELLTRGIALHDTYAKHQEELKGLGTKEKPAWVRLHRLARER
jgi:hypothetical protein